jgi:hypothetical protein
MRMSTAKKPNLYTMSTTTPGSWQQLVEVLHANPGCAVRDLRPLGEPSSEDETTQWRNVQYSLSAESVPCHYVWLGLFLPEVMELPVRHLCSRLSAGYTIICFDRSPVASESLRMSVVARVKSQVPDVIHRELAWQNTSLRDEPKLIRFLCSVYGRLQNIARVEVEIEGLSGGYRGTPHNEAIEIRVYGLDGSQRLPDFSLPYWQTILDSYPLLFSGDATDEEKLKSVQELLVYEREYLEAGLTWPACDGQYVSPLIFEF